MQEEEQIFSPYIGNIGNDSSIIFRIKDELIKESDRGCTLVSAAYIEAELKKIISSFSIKMSAKESEALFMFNGPIGTFSSKIKLAYSLGLISQEISFSIDQLRKIRNICAHLEEPFDFNKGKIESYIKNMIISNTKSFPTLRDELIGKILVIISTLHFNRVNIHRRDSLKNVIVEIMESQHEQEIHLTALRMMEISCPDINYEQALNLARKMEEIIR